jgi:RNA polymerase sigma factor (TIGR02999 family)
LREQQPESLPAPIAPDAVSDPEARQELFSGLYKELRRLAHLELKRTGFALTLGATTLLHEAYLNIGERQRLSFPDRGHFLAYASRAMRGLVIDYARNRQALKRGAGFEITAIPTDVPEPANDSEELQRLSDAIEQLAIVNPRQAQIVDLKYFSGFTFGDIAAMWNISERTIQRDWEKARLFLHQVISDPDCI